MTIFTSRDYSPATTGYQTLASAGTFFTPVMYQLSVFLYRVLGYSVIGSTGWNLDTTVKVLNITNATNTCPIQITTSTPHGFTGQSQSVVIAGVVGNTAANNAVGSSWGVNVTGANTFTLTGSAGNGTYTSGGTVSAGFFYASGLISDGYGAGINFGGGVQKEVSIPIEKRKVISGAAPAGDIGKMLVLKSTSFPMKNSGCFKITGVNFGNTTTIAAGSNGQSLPQATINVASTTGFPTSGTIFVTTSTGTFTVAYTGVTASSFTGCSGGSGTMSTGGAVANLNRYIIDYRSTENPPSENTNSIDWWLYEIENAVSTYLVNFQPVSTNILAATNASPIQLTISGTLSTLGFFNGQKVTVAGVGGNTAANGNWTITTTGNTTFTLNGSIGNGTYTSGGTVIVSNYPGDDISPNNRIILQSPHSSGWQVRIALEPNSVQLPPISISTGFSGNSVGDFPPNTIQTHIVEYLDAASPIFDTNYRYLIVGGVRTSTAGRVSIMADGYGQSVFLHNISTGGTANGVFVFGVPDNEPLPLAPDTERTFVYGSSGQVVSGPVDFGGIIPKIGTANNIGLAVNNGSIKLAALASWGNLDGGVTTPIYSSNAGDTPFSSTTEVLPIEIWSGINCDIAATGGTSPPFFFDPKFMGTTPFTRIGRANFGAFTLSSEEVTTRTVTNATNASPIQITTSAVNALVTGQTVTVSGVGGNTAANGTWKITVINTTNFTLNNSVGNGTYTSGGVANGCPRWLHLQNGMYLVWDSVSGLTP